MSKKLTGFFVGISKNLQGFLNLEGFCIYVYFAIPLCKKRCNHLQTKNYFYTSKNILGKRKRM